MLFIVGVDPGSEQWDAMPFLPAPDMHFEGTRELNAYLEPAGLFLDTLGGGECIVNVPDELVWA